jgi:hypothetical protein
MKTTKALALMVLGAALLLAASAPVQASSTARVGDFVVQLARVKSLNSADPYIAADALAAVGVRLPADLDLDKRLTEGDVVSISRMVGLRVTTSRPGQQFDSSQLERFFSSFGGELRAADGENPGQGSGPGNGNDGPPFDPFTKGQGKAKGKAKRPESPTEPF